MRFADTEVSYDPATRNTILDYSVKVSISTPFYEQIFRTKGFPKFLCEYSFCVRNFLSKRNGQRVDFKMLAKLTKSVNFTTIL